MKLNRLQLLDGGEPTTKRYKSLEPFNQSFFQSENDLKEVDPICFIGVNGSGKSNFLELLAEIFFFIESYFLKYIPASTQKTFNIRFELEYYLHVDGKKTLICIKRKTLTKPVFLIFDEKANKFIEVKNFKKQEELLPKRVIGYSSGNNETLSTAFKTSQIQYSAQVGNLAIPNSKKKLDPKDVKPPRLLYMDYETNELVLISNFLFKSKTELQLFKDLLRIDSLHSFRIILQFNHTAAPKGGIKLTDELDTVVQNLVKCSTTYSYNPNSNSYILDFFNHHETRKAFKRHFVTAQNLFTALYKLVLLNPLCVKGKENRKWTIYTSIFPPDKAFRIELLRLNLTHPRDTIDYKGISDGEHQFIHVVGTSLMFDDTGLIYLLDEPETHFNPQWRSEYITSLNKVVSNNPQEYLITTHSPFILSDCHGYNVFVFKREEDKVWFEPIGIETFGSSFQVLLKQAFNKKKSVSEWSWNEMQEAAKSNDIDELNDNLVKFGDSFEKQMLVEKINSLLLSEQKKS